MSLLSLSKSAELSREVKKNKKDPQTKGNTYQETNCLQVKANTFYLLPRKSISGAQSGLVHKR